MKRVQTDVYRTLGFYKIVALVSIGAVVVIALYAMAQSRQQRMFEAEHVYGVNDMGERIPLKLLNRREVRMKEMQHTINLFISNFYDYDKFSYDAKINKALMLSDKNADDIYLNLENQGWFNEIAQFNIIQHVEEISEPVVTGDAEPYQFRAQAIISVHRDNRKNTFRLTLIGNIIEVSVDYPNNPHGLLLTNIFEDELTKIKS